MFTGELRNITVGLLNDPGKRARAMVSAYVSLFWVVILMSTSAMAADRVLSLVSSRGADTIKVTQGSTFDVEVRVNDASGIAGASFTVTYSTAHLILSGITSTFFDTFVEQGIPAPNDQGYVTVDSINYYSPLVMKHFSTGSMVSAARKDNGSGTDVALFTLHFISSGSTGVYPLSVTASTVNNTEAGFSADGEQVPLLVGIGNDNTYPSFSATQHDCVVLVEAAVIDTDGDGIDDAWEVKYATSINSLKPLSVFTRTGDYDHDRYSDYQEYLNSRNGINDPKGTIFNPTVQNTPGGTGYDDSISAKEDDTILLFLPSIILGAKHKN